MHGAPRQSARNLLEIGEPVKASKEKPLQQLGLAPPKLCWMLFYSHDQRSVIVTLSYSSDSFVKFKPPVYAYET